jgi:hypothetical protein
MKILVVGVFNDNSTNNGIANGFENAGHEVHRYNYRVASQSLSMGDQGRDRDLCSVFRQADFNLVVFCKCNGVDVRVLKECKTKTFLWYMDPLNGNYNDELKEKIKVADYVGVAKWEVYLEAKKLNPNTHFLIEGFDPKWDYPIPSETKHDITFIGNPYGDRAKWLDGVTILSNKYNTEHAKVVGQSRININLTGGGGPSDRAYKILAAGGFLLSERWPDVEKYGLMPYRSKPSFLSEIADYVEFDNVDEMINRCNYYLQYKDERNKIAKHGYQTVQKFSRDNLAKQIIDIVK